MLRRHLRTIGMKMDDLDDYAEVRCKHKFPEEKKKKDQGLMNQDEPSTSYLASSSRRGQCASTSSGANPQLTTETQASINIPPTEPQSGSDTGTEGSRSATPQTQSGVGSSTSSNAGNVAGSDSATVSSMVSEGGNSNRLLGRHGAIFNFENTNTDYTDLDLDYDPNSEDLPLELIQLNIPVDNSENSEQDEIMEVAEDPQPAQPESPQPQQREQQQ